MIVSIFVRRLKEGCTFEQFIAEWEADEGFGVPTRVFNGPSLADPREIMSIGFVAADPAEAAAWFASRSAAEQVRHDRIDTVIESTRLKAVFEVRTEHDFTGVPAELVLAEGASLLAGLADG